MQIGHLKNIAKHFLKIPKLRPILAEKGKLALSRDSMHANKLFSFDGVLPTYMWSVTPVHSSAQSYEKALKRRISSAKYLATKVSRLVDNETFHPLHLLHH